MNATAVAYKRQVFFAAEARERVIEVASYADLHITRLRLMVYSVPTGQLVFSSHPVVRTVRYILPLVNNSGLVGEYFVHRVRQFI